MRTMRTLFAVALVVSVWPAFRAAAEDPKSDKPAAAAKPGKSVDDALLDDLDNELLDGLGDLEDSPDMKSAGDGLPGEEPLEQPDGEDIGMPSADEDPLGHISQQMRMVERLMPEHDKRSRAEQVQRQIVEDLARLIEQAQQRRAQQRASKSQQRQQSSRRQSVNQPKPAGSDTGKTSNQPAADSTDRLGSAEVARPDPELFKGLLKDTWGNLPEREREQMLQSSRERFLPQYELMIERYYRRLAEEHTK